MAENPRLSRQLWPANAQVDQKTGELSVGGIRISDVIAEFGTPVFLLDEADFRMRPSLLCK
jgi:diaminopimelate decarboxylase